MSKDLEVKMQILLESFPIKCKYFTRDEEECTRVLDLGTDEYFIHVACNCDGDILKCDWLRFKERSIEELKAQKI